jgi:hypothetical protein
VPPFGFNPVHLVHYRYCHFYAYLCLRQDRANLVTVIWGWGIAVMTAVHDESWDSMKAPVLVELAQALSEDPLRVPQIEQK